MVTTVPWQLQLVRAAREEPARRPGAPGAVPARRQSSRGREPASRRRPARLAGRRRGSRSTVGPVAHGGHCVARHEGRVVFVRHALPGERVGVAGHRGPATATGSCAPTPSRCSRPRPTGSSRRARTPARPLRRLRLAARRRWRAQRALKAAVVARAARAGWPGSTSTVDGRAGARRRRRARLAHPGPVRGRRRGPGRACAGTARHDVVPVDDCLDRPPSASPARGVLERRWPGDAGRRRRSTPPTGDAGAVPSPVPTAGRGARDGRRERVEHAATGAATFRGRRRAASGRSTRAPPTTLRRRRARRARRREPGERALDLYAGVGLFARRSPTRSARPAPVLAVEADRPAVRRRPAQPRRPAPGRGARRAGRPGARGRWSAADPRRPGRPRPAAHRRRPRRRRAASPRCGPRAVAYVACDPAALARDVALLRRAGLRRCGRCGPSTCSR